MFFNKIYIYGTNVYWRVGYKYGHHWHIMTMTGNSRCTASPSESFFQSFFSILLMIVIRLRIQTMRLPLPPPSSSDGSSSNNRTWDVTVPSSASRASGMFLFLFGSLIKFTNTNTIYLWGYTVQGQGRGPTLYAYISMKFYSNQNHSGRDSYFYY